MADLVQTQAYQVQQGLVAFDLFHFKRRGQAIARQVIPGFAETGGAGHPQNDLQIAQSAR